jgi:thiamine-phosphate pyrophosphorylase
VNDRADLARLAGAGGVHVGQTDLSPAAVRAVVGPELVVGRSTHTPDQYEAAFGEPVDYVAIGPVFATATKATGCDEVGLEGVRRAAARTAARGLPLVAIGGITLDRARSVRDAGAQSIAVISDLFATGDPAGRVREFLRALE